MSTRVLVPLALVALSHGASLPQRPPAASALADSRSFLDSYQRPLPPPGADVARRVRDLLGRMTLEEKVGQMTQLEIGMVTTGKDADLRIDPAKLRKAVVQYGVGSILNVKDLALAPAKWHAIVSAIQAAAAGTRLQIPILYGIDTIHGANY